MKPTEPGFYWVQTGYDKIWNAIAHVMGTTPFLYVNTVYYPWDEGLELNPNLSLITLWGNKIETMGVK